MLADDVTPPARRWLGPQLRRAALEAGVRQADLNVVVVDDARMSELHNQFRGQPGTTDVLSFDLREDVGGADRRCDDEPGHEPIEADIVICRDVAVREADARGHDARLELLLYAIHGLLHLLGEDDRDPASRRRMHQREDELLAKLGLGPIYARRETKR